MIFGWKKVSVGNVAMYGQLCIPLSPSSIGLSISMSTQQSHSCFIHEFMIICIFSMPIQLFSCSLWTLWDLLLPSVCMFVISFVSHCDTLWQALLIFLLKVPPIQISICNDIKAKWRQKIFLTQLFLCVVSWASPAPAPVVVTKKDQVFHTNYLEFKFICNLLRKQQACVISGCRRTYKIIIALHRENQDDAIHI